MFHNEDSSMQFGNFLVIVDRQRMKKKLIKYQGMKLGLNLWKSESWSFVALKLGIDDFVAWYVFKLGQDKKTQYFYDLSI